MTWWSRLWRRSELERDLGREVAFHIEQRIADLKSAGASEDEARRQVRQEFGGMEQVKEECRNARGTQWAEAAVQDVRYSLRILRKSPGFALAAIVTLALGIGANTAIFSVVNAVLLRALPYPEPQRIVRVWEKAPNGRQMSFAEPNFDDFVRQNTTFKTLAMFSGNFVLPVVSGNTPARIEVAAVSHTFFECLAVEPFRGRAFRSGRPGLNSAPAAVVSYDYWQQHLGSTTDLSQVHLTIDGTPYPVIGVMPVRFDFPANVSIWIPTEIYPKSTSRTGHNWSAIGRLREGVSVAQARADLSTIAHRIRNQFGKNVDLNDAAVTPLADALVGDVRTALLTLLGAVGLLLLVACSNVAGLLVARTSARRKELAVRAALGAGRGRLIQQFLAESFSLSLAGGVLGVLTAVWAVRMLPAILPANLPRQGGIAIDAPVLLFALAATVAVAVALGLFAAWRAAASDLQQALASGSRGYSGSRESHRLRGLVVIGEVALTLVMLTGAGLLGRSFVRLISTSPGFNPQNLTVIEFSLVNPQGQIFALNQASIARQVRLIDDLSSRLRAIPGTTAVGLAGAFPVAAGDNLADGTFLLLNGQKPPANIEEWEHMAQNPSQTGRALYAVASEAYFRALGISLVRGRFFADGDDWSAPHVAVISQALARQRWPNQNPIGQTIEFGNMDGNMKSLTIVGIAGDVRAEGLDSPPSAVIYVNYRQRGININSSPTILMRSAAPTGQIVSAARTIFRDLAPDVPFKFSTFADEMGGWLSDRRFLLLLVALFAAVALALAAVGVYGVVAFSVTRRTQEIGIRMALGAQRSDVLRLLVGEGARLAMIGVGIGLVASLAITRLLSSLLFGVSATDPITFIGVAALLTVVALLASYLPARRALRLNPNSALRYE